MARKISRKPSEGSDLLKLTNGDDVVDALGGNDTINGKDGDDILIGNLSADRLIGGAGADTFVYKAAADSASASGKWSKGTGDTIRGFVSGTDKIDLTGLGALSFGTGPAKKGVWAETTGKATFLHADTDNDGVADLSIKLAGKKTVSASDIVVAQALPPAGAVTLQVAGDNKVSVGEITNGNVALTGTVTGDAKAGDTVTLTANGKTITAQVGADLKYSANVALADILADTDKTIEVKVTVTSPTGVAGTIEGKATYTLDATKPVITLPTTLDINENTVAVVKATADTGVTWTLSGADKDLFQIAADGSLRFKNAPDFETKLDAGTNGVYDITLTATNALGVVSDSKALAVTVANVAETANMTGVVFKDAQGKAFPDGTTLGIGKQVFIDVTFDSPVVVTGSPGLAMNAVINSNADEAVLAPQSGTGTKTLHFIYTVKAGSVIAGTNDLGLTDLEQSTGNTIKSQDGASVVFVDSLGNPAGVLAIDAIAPDVPDGTLKSTNVSDVANNTLLTTDSTPKFEGTANPDVASVEIWRDNENEPHAIVDVQGGNWTWEEGVSWADGKYEVKFRALDAAGNASDFTNPFSVTVDTAAPNTPSLTMLAKQGNNGPDFPVGNFGYSSDDLPAFSGTVAPLSGTVADATEVVIKISTQATDAIYGGNGLTFIEPVDAQGKWSHDLNSQAATNPLGVPFSLYTVTATARDLAGNLSGIATYNFIYWYSNTAVINTTFFSNGSDWILGSSGKDRFSGQDGDDHIEGGAGDDNLSGDAGNDFLSGGMGYDSLYGSIGDDVLDAGPDGALLFGSKGIDKMTGDPWAKDVFMFDPGDSVIGDGLYDVITGFTHGTDIIQVGFKQTFNMFEDTGSANNTFDNFALSASNAFQIYDVFVRYNYGNSGDTLVAIDTPLLSNDVFGDFDICVLLKGFSGTLDKNDFLFSI